MTIKRRKFESGNFEVKNTDRCNHPVALVLRKNTSLAYRVDELVKYVKLSEEGIRGMLQIFVELGWVIHKQPYWAWNKSIKKQ